MFWSICSPIEYAPSGLMTNGVAGWPRVPLLRRQRVEEAELLQLAGDVGDGLRRERRQARDVGAREPAMQPDGLHHDAPVVRPGELEIGAGQAGDGRLVHRRHDGRSGRQCIKIIKLK